MLALILAEAAQASAATNATGAIWLTGAFAAAGGVSTVINLAALFATRREVEALEKRLLETRADLAETRREIVEMERRLNQASEERAESTHDRINDVLRELAALGGKFDQSQHR